ncbi:NADH-quinone oxidoreductase subunit NuoN [Fastidiosibacter lacustris]|uniref:NADH-quinone oxidoreductase subunit NuoN n=1 Tax=Fastidiosibacter lacustris TaxID=2056695 RepID=UPI001EFCF6A9|nr:NADH-quinone oxidoreductase subunit NuoN [Fastidiosibacter lacustris]
MMLANIITVLPEITLSIGALVVMLSDLFWGKRVKNIAYILTQLFLIIASWILLKSLLSHVHVGFEGQTLSNELTFVLQEVIVLVAFFVFIYCKEYIEDRQLPQGEFYVLALLSILGALVLTSAHSLLTIYIGLELLSLPLYALLAIRRGFAKGAEAAIKYFVLGAIASGLLLYGMSFIYGITGSLDLTEIGKYLTNPTAAHMDIVLIAMVLMITTATFKLGAVPFHMWVPDVYEGSPNAVTAFLASVPKVAAFAMLVNILMIAMPAQSFAWTKVLMVLAVISIFFGNLMALAQKNLKRLLGYSTISHVGFVLLALILNPTAFAVSTALFYVIIYVLMSAAAFGVLIVLSVKGNDVENLGDFAGLNRRNPWIAFLMLIVMFSMAGIPPLSGFTAKLFVIMGLVDTGHLGLAIYALIMSVIAAYYYLRVIKVMYFELPKNQTPVYANKVTLFGLSINTGLILLLGVFPALLVTLITPIYMLF